MTKVINIQLSDKSLAEAVVEIIENCLDEKYNLCISATGGHGLVYAKRHHEFSDVLQSYYLNLPDGVPTVWVGRLKGAKHMGRCYGPDYFREVIIASKDKDIKHYFCGGKEGVAEDLKKICEIKYDNFNVVGTVFTPVS